MGVEAAEPKTTKDLWNKGISTLCKQGIGITDTAAHSVLENIDYMSYQKIGKSFKAVTLEKGLDIKVRELVFNAILYEKGNCCCLYKENSSSSWRA